MRVRAVIVRVAGIDHVVEPKPDGTGFIVTSGRSGRRYELPLTGRFTVTCPCASREPRCSHVRAVEDWAARVLAR